MCLTNAHLAKTPEREEDWNEQNTFTLQKEKVTEIYY